MVIIEVLQNNFVILPRFFKLKKIAVFREIAMNSIAQAIKCIRSPCNFHSFGGFRTLIIPVFLVLTFSPMVSAQQGSEKFYVSADTGNIGDGSQESPFNSLSAAESASKAGDTIYLLSNSHGMLIDGNITLKPRQKLLGVDASGKLLEEVNHRVQLTNTSSLPGGVMVQLADNNEVAGIHFMNMGNYAIAGENTNYSGTYIHHTTFTGNAEEHIEDERGLVYAISFNGATGELTDIRVEDSRFYFGEDLGAIRVFQSGDSRGSYLFQRNDFSDLGGRAYFVRTQHNSRVETIILDSTADNIGRGNRNSDSIIPYLMGQSEQIMLVRNYHFKNTNQEGSASNTGIEAYLFGSPRPDEANWCTACKLTFKIFDSVIENAVTDGIQFSNAGTNSELAYEIRDTKIIGGNPRQGGGAISLNLQSTADSGSHTTLVVENTEMIGTTGYGFAMNNRGGGEFVAVIDFGGGALGSLGKNSFVANERGAMRVPPSRITASDNWWNGGLPRIFDAEDVVFPDSRVEFAPLLNEDPR